MHCATSLLHVAPVSTTFSFKAFTSCCGFQVHTVARRGRGTDDMVDWRIAPLDTTKRAMQKVVKKVKSRISRESQDQSSLPYDGSSGVLPQRKKRQLGLKKAFKKPVCFGASQTL